MVKNGAGDFANIIIPKEMVPYESDKAIGILYKFVDEEIMKWDTAILFISKKFVKKSGLFSFKVGFVKTWIYTAKTNMGKPISIPASKLIFYVLNERNKHGNDEIK